SGVLITDHVVGSGALPIPGATVKLVYTGMLSDGTVVLSHQKRTQPMVFRKGVNQVVKGLDQGLDTMRVGGSREITVPSALGYGEAGYGSIPSNETLVFRVTLV
ncbi:FKBP-type peptidyl-prolyl cis-trans isomerases 1, partial [Ochromonadaceae sp. CCMP2298]